MLHMVWPVSRLGRLMLVRNQVVEVEFLQSRTIKKSWSTVSEQPLVAKKP